MLRRLAMSVDAGRCVLSSTLTAASGRCCQGPCDINSRHLTRGQQPPTSIHSAKLFTVHAIVIPLFVSTVKVEPER